MPGQDDGTWLDPLQVIRDGIGGKETNDTVGNDTTTESQEELLPTIYGS